MELDWLKRWSLYSGHSIAISDGESGRSFTYHQLFESAQKAAQLLRNKFSVQEGDRVALLAQNELESVILFFALHRLGATLVPVNFRLTKREVDHILDDSGAKLVIFQKAFFEQVSHRPERLLDMDDFAVDLRKQNPLLETYLSHAETAALILYTSGTTGSPKGAILSHRMLFWNSINTSLRLNITQSDATVIFLPFFHTGGWNVLTTPFLHRGARIILLKKFDADRILELSAREKCTLLFGVPTTMDLMAQSPLFKESDLSHIRYAIVGGEPMPLPLIEIWNQKSIPVRQGYGLTEFGPNVFSLNEEDAVRKMGSIGFPNFYIEAKVVDEQGRELGADEIGELVLKGPMAMSGYWRNEKATHETLRDGWLYTGDLVRRDHEGYYFVVGRKKDMFISGGENVYPPEVEQVLRSHPEVRECAVIGIPDEKWGEVGCAFVVAPALAEPELRQHCLKNLAKFKIPKEIYFVTGLPKGDSGKILKRELKDQYLNGLRQP